jgi:hypothetical protein
MINVVADCTAYQLLWLDPKSNNPAGKVNILKSPTLERFIEPVDAQKILSPDPQVTAARLVCGAASVDWAGKT